MKYIHKYYLLTKILEIFLKQAKVNWKLIVLAYLSNELFRKSQKRGSWRFLNMKQFFLFWACQISLKHMIISHIISFYLKNIKISEYHKKYLCLEWSLIYFAQFRRYAYFYSRCTVLWSFIISRFIALQMTKCQNNSNRFIEEPSEGKKKR